MTALPIPSIALNDGNQIPQVGLGVFMVEPGETERIVSEALEVGYRHIDTAHIYHNEKGVGRAIANSGIPREELFITTKLWNTDHEDPRSAFEKSLDRLGLDRLDLYLIHWPMPMLGTALDAWRGMVQLIGAGLTESIGVSNFEIEHLRELHEETGVVPAINQVELHPFHQRRDLRAYCQANGIAVEAWGPLAQGKSDLLRRPAVTNAGVAHSKSPAQVVLRWHVQQGTIVIPKTTRKKRMLENADLFDFSLTEAQMAAIGSLDAGQNFGPDPRTFDVL
ncbi:aldo/keto reductase [Leucobacter sp. W1478]|uniref:aldo/keto reductase n=1 Tax=Leucobacter sp. W1478 TaxID=3439065 RepID=UPI003F385DBC